MAPPLTASAETSAPLHRTRSEVSLSVDRPHELTKQHSIDSELTTRASVVMDRPARRLSMPYNKPLRGKYPTLVARSTNRRYQDTLKTERFERMMDRFQLRRVPLQRSHSNNSTATLTSQRDAAGTTRTQHDPYGLISGKDNDTINELHSEVAVSDPEPWWVTTATKTRMLLREPLRPTGCATQLRLVASTTLLILQLALFPFVLVYAHTDESLAHAWLRVSLAADAVFLLSIILQCNTATYTARGQVVRTRRAIFRQYRRRGLFLDVLAVVPLERLTHHGSWMCALCLLAQVVLRSVVVCRQLRDFQFAWTDTLADHGAQHTWLDWLLYSRFAHLVRIGWLVFVVVLISHYLACAWTFLQAHSDPTFESLRSPFAIHLHSIYDVLQMLQGQGVATSTPAQDVFGSFTVLLGSIALAVVFGHVAVLVSNFSANQTSYQRKMERVFAVMGKLQLPNPIRERVHQYYQYLHAEYESLDGEIVKFAKDLSHTLELEVVLFKYMDVVMHVPHWRECSPDFQKQLVLNLSVRVYLPDDFVIRRGEVGAECYIINRGMCKQHGYPGGIDEPATPPLVEKEPEELSSTRRGSARVLDVRYAMASVPRSHESSRSMGEGYQRSTTLLRGQAFGEKALVTNYLRSSDVRAFTYVEMCVLERETFQRILTRYPNDRRSVLTNMVRHCIHQRAMQGTECEMTTAVHRFAPSATFDEVVGYVVEAMNPPACDPSIRFGTNGDFESGLERATRGDHTGDANPQNVSETSDGGAAPIELVQQVQTLQTQLNRMESVLQEVIKQLSAHDPSASTPSSTQPPARQPVTRAQTPKLAVSGAKVAPARAASYRATRLYRRASDVAVSGSAPTTYADRLFKTQRVIADSKDLGLARTPHGGEGNRVH